MANAGEKYLINDIAVKAALIADLINENDELHERMVQAEDILTPAQKKKLGLD